MPTIINLPSTTKKKIKKIDCGVSDVNGTIDIKTKYPRYKELTLENFSFGEGTYVHITRGGEVDVKAYIQIQQATYAAETGILTVKGQMWNAGRQHAVFNAVKVPVTLFVVE